jgi:AAA+ superfamily predicted ATPase
MAILKRPRRIETRVMPDTPPSGGACRVLVSGVEPRLLRGLVEMLLASRADAEVISPRPGLSDEDIDLAIEGVESTGSQIPRLIVSVNGAQSRLDIPYGELSQEILNLAVDAAIRRQPARDWYELLLKAWQRFDAILSQAVEIASDAYMSGGGFTEWAEAFRAGRTDFGGEPLSGSRVLPSLLIDRDPLAAIPQNSAVGRLIRDYDLTGRQFDVLLACLFNELDARYSQRYAFLVGDTLASGPTSDVLAALLTVDSRDRLELLTDLTSGVLVASGMISRGPADAPLRGQMFALDRSVLRIFMSDESPDPTDVILDPRLTARAPATFAQISEQMGRVADGTLSALERGDVVHVHGGIETSRRSRALDIAAAAECRLLAVPWAAFSGYDHAAAHTLRRDCIRLGVRCLVEGVPRVIGPDQLRNLLTADVALTSGPEPLPPGGTAHVWNDEARQPTLAERRIIWSNAASWTGAIPADGLEPLIRRFGVPIDRAADILGAAATANTSFTSRDVAATVAQYTMDDADGLLRTVQPRARLDDLVLAEDTRRALIDAKNRIVNRDLVFQQLGWDWMTDRLTGTYLLFAGPAGTGKTIAAEALAHELGLPVQLLEISALFSRWVGDFEEHVDKVFAAAQASGALLVANEADAILGPRTQVVHGQDRYANAGTAHILSRLEQFAGYVVFTTNLLGTNNIDPAFHRRITALVRFHQPDAEQREALWRSVWPPSARDGNEVVLRFDLGPDGRDAYFRRLAQDYPLSGGSISNIARSATFLAAARDDDIPTITERDVKEALAQELAKIGDFRSLTLARSRK